MATPSNASDDIKRANYAAILLSASMTAVTHPVQLTKVLIQVFLHQWFVFLCELFSLLF